MIFIFLIMGITCWFLATTNTIKANRVTKLFYYDDEGFIKSWEKTKGKVILMYNIKNVIIFTIGYGITGLANFFRDNNSIMYWREHMLLLVVTVIMFSLLSILFRSPLN